MGTDTSNVAICVCVCVCLVNINEHYSLCNTVCARVDDISSPLSVCELE